MRFLSALVIFLTFTSIAVGVLVYSKWVKATPLYAQNRHRVELPHDSIWFESQSTGEACYTWFTCISGGARVRGVYLDQGDARYALGDQEDVQHFVDTNGKSPVGVTFEKCRGADHGISVKLYPNVLKNAVKVNIMNQDTSRVKTFTYNLPADVSLGDTMEAVVVFEAQTGDIWQVYEQSSHIQGCI